MCPPLTEPRSLHERYVRHATGDSRRERSASWSTAAPRPAASGETAPHSPRHSGWRCAETIYTVGPPGLAQLSRRRVDRPGRIALQGEEFAERLDRALLVPGARRELGVAGQDVRAAAPGNVFLENGQRGARLRVFLVLQV